MSMEKFDCLGDSVGFEACFGREPAVTAELGSAACMSCVVVAYRKLAEENESLRVQAERDGLTELSNRRVFNKALEESVSEQEPFGLVFIDIRSFSEVNARELHVGGDIVLKDTAEYLEDYFSNTLRRNDLIARIGGDEFGIILRPSHTGSVLVEPQLEIIKDRLEVSFLELPKVEAYNQQYGDNSPLGLHIGTSLWQPGMTAIDMLAEADPKYNKHSVAE